MPKINLKNVDISLISITFVAFVLRFVNLNYSDFQGDEIKALFIPDPDQSIFSYLLSQRKGPLQFLITYLIKLIDPSYQNQFMVRFIFALAGVLSVYFFYKLVKMHFGSKIASFASFFMATNGFFIAFARIAQYQSLVILFGILSLYMLSIAVMDVKYAIKGLVWSVVFLALSVLAHYDAIFFAPVYTVLLYDWLNNVHLAKPAKIKTFVLSSILFLVMTLSFYGPFALALTESTKSYWEGRLTGGVSEKLSSSYYLFTVYQPIYVIHFYILLTCLAALAYILCLLPLAKVKLKAMNYLVKPAKEIFSADRAPFKMFVVLIWFLIPFFVWEKLVYIPGTHIYTYIIPLLIIIACGLAYAENFWDFLMINAKFIKPVLVKNIFMGLFLTFLALQAYAIYVDNQKEYPWEDEKFLFWTLSVPTPSYHLSLFGFPYYRDWESIGRFIARDPSITYYSTNERDSIARHYVHLPKDANKAGYYIYVKNPQTLTNELPSEKALYWASKYPPVYTLSKDGEDLVSIYLMDPIPLEELILKGK